MENQLIPTTSGGILAERTTAWLAGISNQHTKTAYTRDLADFAAWLGARLVGEPFQLNTLPVNLPSQFDASDVKAYIADGLAKGLSKSTVGHRVYTLHGWIRHLVDQGHMHPDRAVLILAVRAPRAVNRSHRRYLTNEQVQQVLDAIGDDRLLDRRDKCMLATLAWTGLRRSELCQLNVGQLEKANGHWILNDVRRKGGGTDFVKIQPALAVAILGWLEAAGIADPDAPLFQSVNKGDRPTGKRLDGEAVRLVVQRRTEAAGFEGIRPHSFRRGFATNALSAGATTSEVQHAGGWRSRAMVDRYDLSAQNLEHNGTDYLNYRL